MPLEIGWCIHALEATVAFQPPIKFIPPKDRSKAGRGFLSCPAVRSYFEGVFYVKSPFSLRLRCTDTADGMLLQPVYPFTSLTPERFREFISVELPGSWRNSKTVVLQFPSPYVFVADEPASIEQFSPSLSEVQAMNWRVIPGQFDILLGSAH